MRRGLACALALLAGACGSDPQHPTPLPSASPTPRDPIIAAAGDIACGTATGGAPCRYMETANLVEEMAPDLALPLGDTQYEAGSYPDFINFYDRSWGQFLAVTRPVVGNHEYLTPDAKGYFDYFNGLSASSGRAGDRDKGYYSFNIGEWHLIAINSECAFVRGCGAGSPQERWLRDDLRQNPRACTLAYWHRPRFSSGVNGNTPQMQAIWQALYDANVDVILNAHDHNYERFAPLDPAGRPDPARGIRQFIVGTGGRNLTRFRPTIQANSEVRDNASFGVLRVRLHPGTYDWQFFPIPGDTLTDRGLDLCH